LVYADWLEDQGIDARHIREPGDVNIWHYVAVYDRLVMVGNLGVVGSSFMIGSEQGLFHSFIHSVGYNWNNTVGTDQFYGNPVGSSMGSRI
jgi:hypothetical protein